MFELGRFGRIEDHYNSFDPEDHDFDVDAAATFDEESRFALQALIFAMVAKVVHNAEAGDTVIVPLPTDRGSIPDAANLRAEIAGLGGNTNSPLVSEVVEGNGKAVASFQCV